MEMEESKKHFELEMNKARVDKKEVEEVNKVVGELRTENEEMKKLWSDVVVAKSIERSRGEEENATISAGNLEREDRKLKAEVSEAMDRENRKKNLIIMGLPEAVEGTAEEDDAGKVKILLTGLLDGEPVRIGLVERIGTNPGKDKPRPLRVTIEYHVARRNLLLRAKKLKEGPDTKKIFIVPDLTR